MSASIVTFPGAKAAELSRKSRFQRGDTTYWRRLEWDFHNDMRRHGCRCCLGTGEMLVYIDEPAEPCARCQIANPWTLNPHDDVPF